MFMYFDFSTYFRMMRLAWGERDPKARRKVLFILLLIVPIASSVHALFFFLDPIFFPALWRVQAREPVFIVGHARSGTTLMHRLMTADGERFSYFRMYEMFFPSLIEKKLIRWLGVLDEHYANSWMLNKFKKLDDKMFGAMRDVHNMSLWAPEEDDFIHTFSCASGFWIVLLPYMRELDFFYVDRWPAAKRRRIMNFYAQCVKRQLVLNGSNKLHLSKNPTFSGRVESLVETFPGARIVVMARNPYETIPSLLKLMQGSWFANGWTKERMQDSLEALAQQSYDNYLLPFEALAKHPQVRQAIVDYRDLVAEPKRTVETVYKALELEMSEAFRERLEGEEKRARAHETSHTYSLAEFGLDQGAIRRELATLFARFSWDEPGHVS